MSLGPAVRRSLGPLESRISRIYRSLFFSLGRFGDLVSEWVSAEDVLEIGCGDGYVTTQLASALPKARILGIDIASEVGRMFSGDSSRVEFARCSSEECAAAHPHRFDLIVICDVLHHVPSEQRARFLASARATLRPGGHLLLKEWEHRPTAWTAFSFWLETRVSGAYTRYETRRDWIRSLTEAFGPDCIVGETRLPPWRNNLALLVQAPMAPARPEPLA